MNQDITSRPIKLLMLLSAVCLLSFFYFFTENNLDYLDSVDEQIANNQINHPSRQHILLPQIQEAQLNQANGDSP